MKHKLLIIIMQIILILGELTKINGYFFNGSFLLCKKPNDSFNFVYLVDLKVGCQAKTPFNIMELPTSDYTNLITKIYSVKNQIQQVQEQPNQDIYDKNSNPQNQSQEYLIEAVSFLLQNDTTLAVLMTSLDHCLLVKRLFNSTHSLLQLTRADEIKLGDIMITSMGSSKYLPEEVQVIEINLEEKNASQMIGLQTKYDKILMNGILISTKQNCKKLEPSEILNYQDFSSKYTNSTQDIGLYGIIYKDIYLN
eukprot:403364404